MAKTYTCNYEGQRYDYSAKGWFEFLRDKPVFAHYSVTRMQKRLNARGDTLMTIGQALGISEHRTGNRGLKKSSPAVTPSEMGQFKLVNELLNKIACGRVVV